ncbi:MAG: Ig-like domain-containing protein [Solirubrobacteraceae bacterium]
MDGGKRARIVAIAAAVCALASAAPASAAELIQDSFKNSTVNNPNYLVGGSAWTPCLTASQLLNQVPVPGCPLGQPSLPANGDPDGDGALRLTSNNGFSSGFILYQDALPLTAGLDIRFSFYAYNGSGADGFSFFVADGAEDLTQPGADGGSLGYAQRNDTPGLLGGYFGVGIDEYGNFANDGENRGNGCSPHPENKLYPDHVSLRGPGSGVDQYCRLATTGAGAIGSLDKPGATDRDDGVQRDVRITVDPLSQSGAQVTVYLKTPAQADYTEVLRQPLPPNPPPTFKFGFSASTGGSTNIHEIRTLVVDSINPLPRLKLEKSNNGPFVTGGSGTFTLTAGTERGTGIGPVGSPVTVTDTFPAGTITATPRGAGWDCSATTTGSSALSCTRPAPIPAGTTLPPISVPVAWDEQTSGEYVNVAEVDSLDNANSPEQSQARDPYVVRPIGADDSATTRVGRPVSLPLLANDRGSLDPTTVRVRKPAHGFAFWSAGTEELLYVPHPGYSGIERFTYTVRDTSGQRLRQNITITVTPFARNDSTATPFETPVRIPVLRNDRGSLDPATVTVIRPPANGTTAVDAKGRVTYTPNTGFTGRDTFDYRVADRDGQAVTATVTVDVGPPTPTPPNPGTPDLVVTKTADRHAVVVGELVTFHVVVENRGDGPAEDVVLVDTPVFDVDVVSVDVSQGTCEAGPPPICSLGTIPAGGKVTITVGIRPQEPGLLRNGVAATGPSAETGNANNGDVAGVVVRDRGASVRITKRADRRRMRPGGKVVYTIRVTSRGPETARNLRICDFLPRGMQAVRAPGGTIRGQRVCWRRAKAKVGRQLRYQVQARATLAGPPVRINPVAVAGANFAARVAAARVRVIGGQRACASAAGGPVARAAC